MCWEFVAMRDHAEEVSDPLSEAHGSALHPPPV